MEEYENFDAMQERAHELVERWDEEKERAEPRDPEAEPRSPTESSRTAKTDEAQESGTGPGDPLLPAR